MLAGNPLRVAVIGNTGRGNYGHGLDVAWLEVPGCQVVAVADPDPAGRASAVQRLGQVASYANYQEMLDKERPDIVSVAPRWVDEHHDMLLAAAERQVHVYLEKPLCRSLQEADAMVSACQQHQIKVAIAFQTRYSPVLQQVRELIEAGQIGQLLELRARGLDDHRGGAEDLHVLGCHLFNLMHLLGGAPRWCFSEILQQNDPARPEQRTAGGEGLGPVVGDQIDAMFGLTDGIHGYYAVRRNTRPPEGLRYGLQIVGSRGQIQLGIGYLPAAYLLADPQWSPGKSGARWQPITSQGVDMPEPLAGQTNHHGNIVACRDLVAAIAEDRQPEANIWAARTTLEMAAAVLTSHCQQRRVDFPLPLRDNPLTRW